MDNNINGLMVIENSNLKNGPPSNLSNILLLFDKIYDNNFWGNKSYNMIEGHNHNRQKILRDFMKYIIDKSADSFALQILFKSAFIVYPSRDKEVVENGINKKIPYYYGRPAWGEGNDIKIFKELIDEFRKNLFYEYNKEAVEKIDCPADNNDPIFEQSFSANISAISPYYSYAGSEFKYEGLMGVINTAGANFESQFTADYKKHFKNNWQDLKGDIFLITESVIFASHKLAKDNGYFIAYPLIPLFGLGCFSKYCEDKKNLVNLYVEGLCEACKKYSDRDGVQIIPVFFNIGNKQKTFLEKQIILVKENIEDESRQWLLDLEEINDWHYDAYMKYFNKQGEEIKSYYIWGSLFQKINYPQELDLNNGLLCMIVAGDAHSFIGNGGYQDYSLERYYLGFNNENFLSPFHLLNIVLPALAGKSYPQELLWSDYTSNKGNVRKGIKLNEPDMTDREELEKILNAETKDFVNSRSGIFSAIFRSDKKKLIQEVPQNKQLLGNSKKLLNIDLQNNPNLAEYDKDSDRKKSNKNYMWWISGIGIFGLLGILIYKKLMR